MKYIVIVPDGMADEPIGELNGKTPLEAANTVNMDHLCKNGYNGLIKTIPDGMHPGSDIGNMSILGYAPEKYHTGRAPLEVANNLSIDFQKGDVAFRCNLVTIVDGKMADHSAGHISTQEAKVLIEALNEKLAGDGIQFYLGKSYRHSLIMKVRDPKIYCKIETKAPHDILGQSISKHLPKGKESELLLKFMEISKEVLGNHPINQVRIDLNENPADMIWLWGQGTKPELPGFKDKFGLEGGIISAVDLVNGIGRLAGLEIIDVPGITGYYDTNFEGKAQYALDFLRSKDFVYIHIEAPDEAGHNGDFKAKIEAIENIDRHIVGSVLNHYSPHDDIRILVLPDHPTPVKLRTHTNDPVGFVMYGKGVQTNHSSVFSESVSKEKGLLFDSGEKLMEYFIRKNLT